MWPVMALLTSSVSPEMPSPAPQLGLAAESGKKGISDFQPSQHAAPRAAERALSWRWALHTGCGEAQPSEQNHICRAAETVPRHESGSCRQSPAWVLSTQTAAQPWQTARGQSPPSSCRTLFTTRCRGQ